MKLRPLNYSDLKCNDVICFGSESCCGNTTGRPARKRVHTTSNMSAPSYIAMADRKQPLWMLLPLSPISVVHAQGKPVVVYTDFKNVPQRLLFFNDAIVSSPLPIFSIFSLTDDYRRTSPSRDWLLRTRSALPGCSRGQISSITSRDSRVGRCQVCLQGEAKGKGRKCND